MAQNKVLSTSYFSQIKSQHPIVTGVIKVWDRKKKKKKKGSQDAGLHVM